MMLRYFGERFLVKREVRDSWTVGVFEAFEAFLSVAPPIGERTPRLAHRNIL